jgi:hypothetical protein
MLELGENLLDWMQIGAAGWQIRNSCACRLDRDLYAGDMPG